MADGFESERSENYFYGGMKPRPAPRRIKPDEKKHDEKMAAAKQRNPRTGG